MPKQPKQPKQPKGGSSDDGWDPKLQAEIDALIVQNAAAVREEEGAQKSKQSAKSSTLSPAQRQAVNRRLYEAVRSGRLRDCERLIDKDGADANYMMIMMEQHACMLRHREDSPRLSRCCLAVEL